MSSSNLYNSCRDEVWSRKKRQQFNQQYLFWWESTNTSKKCIQMWIQSHQLITKWYFPETSPQPAMSLHPALRWCAHSWAPRLAVGTAQQCWSLTHNRWSKHAQRLKPWGWHAMKPRSFRRLSRKSSKELPGKWRKRLPAGKVATCRFHLEDTPIYRVVRMMLVCMRNGWTP